jgi:hypothetical protein
MPTSGGGFRSAAVRALVLLHDQELRTFLARWGARQAADVDLPITSAQDEASRATFLRHVLAEARGSLAWIALQLEMTDPGIPPLPDVADIPTRASPFVDELLACWRTLLAHVPHERVVDRAFPIRGVALTIESMLEHAVVDPMRHTFRLEELPHGAELPDHAADASRHCDAGALIALHDRHLRRFVASWNSAREVGRALPATPNANYASYDALLRHVLAAARSYMMWMTEQLGLPSPQIEVPPDVGAGAIRRDDYVEHLLAAWRTPLRDVEPERFTDVAYPSWGTVSTIEAKLEHAVVHPMRHALQLDALVARMP